MSDTPRNKVSIISVCAANTAEVIGKITAAKEAKKDAKSLVSAINARHQAEIDASNSELTEITALIKANERQGVPTEKLEKKSSDIIGRIKTLSADHANSGELAAAHSSITAAEADLKLAEELHELCTAREAIAASLKAATLHYNVWGAVEAPEFQTLDEALDEYIANMPLVVSITKDLIVDKVGIWHLPNVSTPYQRNLFAKKDVQYRYNRLPTRMEWLSRFPGSDYSSMPRSNETEFNVDGVAFVVSKGDVAETEDAEEKHAWMGKMVPKFQRQTSSIYAPEGINYTTEQGVYARSGLCYIKSEGKFYSLWNTQFASMEMVPGKVQKPDRWGTMQTEDGMVPKGINSDVSKLFESIFEPLAQKIKAAAVEFSELSSAKSPLSIRLKQAVERVSVVQSTFELRGKRLTEDEVKSEIGAYWEAFTKAPWESIVVGDLAMIKHLCERRIEVPHFWSLAIKGHYGLRVRTRDHDWIIAQIYCPPGKLSPKAPIAADDVVYLKEGLIKVGPCFIIVDGRQK